MFEGATSEFDILNNWIGWGDPRGGVWFIGVEAGGGWHCDSEEAIQARRSMIGQWKGLSYSRYKDLKARDEDDDGQGVNFPIATGTAKIASMVSKDDEGWRHYRENKLWLDGTGVFNANMLPIGKKSLSEWPAGYKSLFGYLCEDYSRRLKEVLEFRSERLAALKEECQPQAIVCFGKSHWGEFERFLSLKESESELVGEMSCKLYPSERVILTRHFSNGMPDVVLKFIAQTLKGWGVSLP